MIWLLFFHYLQTLLTHLVDDLVLDNGANPTLSKNFFWIAIWRLNLAFSILRTSTSRRDCQHWALIVWRPRERTPGLNKVFTLACLEMSAPAVDPIVLVAVVVGTTVVVVGTTLAVLGATVVLMDWWKTVMIVESSYHSQRFQLQQRWWW